MQKNILIVLVGVVIVGAGIAYVANSGGTQTPQVATTEDHGMMASSSEEAMMGPSVMLKDGTYMLEDNGKSTVLSADYIFPDGTKVSLSGAVTKPDGTTAVLHEGESVWPGGSIMKAGENTMGTESMGSSTHMGIMKAGLYAPYDPKLVANAATGKVVLFFHATWCPICHAIDQDARAHLDQIPENTSILVVDYDSSTALRQKYGVTIQHTFVQVDKNGSLIKKWDDSSSLADVLAQIQ